MNSKPSNNRTIRVTSLLQPPEHVRTCALSPRQNVHKRLLIGERIGEGGMSDIEAVFDRNLLRYAARKIIKPSISSDETERARLIEEAQITAQLDHPNIVPVHELSKDEAGNLFFSMKRISGRTFTEILAEKPLEVRTEKDLFANLQIFLKICDAVGFAHSRGVIHRDIKPDNVMVGEFGEVYLMDWGFARLKKPWRPEKAELIELGISRKRFESPNGKNRVTATLNYMAPETLSGIPEDMDERSDIFCLGGILYKILTLRPPFVNNNLKALTRSVLNCAIPLPSEVVDVGLHDRLERICMKALAHRKEERYQSAEELKQDIERFLQSGWQFQRRQYEEGDLIVKEGEPGEEGYVITSGRCRVFQTRASKKVVIGSLGVGDVFGEISVFASGPRTASVECTEKTTLMVITTENFETDLGMSFWLGLFAKALADRFMQSQGRVAELEMELNKNIKKNRQD